MKIENIYVYNLYNAILGIRNSFKSKNESDSDLIPSLISNDYICQNFIRIGNKDEILIRKLLKTPSERKFLRQILVSMDITTSIKHWSQIDTFKVGTIRNSESTMHSISKGFLTQENFNRPINEYHLKYLNNLIASYNQSNKKEDYTQIFELIDANLPGGYLLESHWTANYEVLKNIYNTRKHHKMYYWGEFLNYIKILPYFNLLIEE